MRIDHVMYGVRDLSDASAWFSATLGLPVMAGGEHPQWGTANAVIPVGDEQYIELISVADPDSTHPLARFVATRAEHGDRPIGMCLRPTDLDATARRLDLQITDGSRLRPDGELLRWRLAGVPEALGPDRLPFFIEWPGGGANPELEGTPVDGRGIAWAELAGSADALRAWVGNELSVISVVEGDPGVTRFAVRVAAETVIVGAR